MKKYKVELWEIEVSLDVIVEAEDEESAKKAAVFLAETLANTEGIEESNGCLCDYKLSQTHAIGGYGDNIYRVDSIKEIKEDAQI